MVKHPKKRPRRRVLIIILGMCAALVCICLGVIGGWLLIGEGGRSPLRNLLPNQSARLGEPFIALR